MKWKIATASLVTAAMLSAPAAHAAPGDGNNVVNNVVGQTISQVTGTNPGVILEAMNQVQKVLSKLGFGGGNRGNGNGAELQKATLENVGKTLKKPEILPTTP